MSNIRCTAARNSSRSSRGPALFQVRRAFEGSHQGARVVVEQLRESGKGARRAAVSNEQHQQKRTVLQGIGGVVGGVEATEHGGRLVRRPDLRPCLIEQRIGFTLPTRGALGQPISQRTRKACRAPAISLIYDA